MINCIEVASESAKLTVGAVVTTEDHDTGVAKINFNISNN